MLVDKYNWGKSGGDFDSSLALLYLLDQWAPL